MSFKFHYEIFFHTANEDGAGTNVDIKLKLFGTQNDSDEFNISGGLRAIDATCSGPPPFCDPPRLDDPFEKGSNTQFTHDTDTFYGDLIKIQLKVVDTEVSTRDNPAWKLDYIEIKCYYSDSWHSWKFNVYSWIGTKIDPFHADEQKNDIIINVANS
ncbi:PLAT/LH2 domain-containing protein [Priestia megaterium]|uniref:PLAT/LH2 domain-containing protein n=1 Tax=Priestia megaterium TaxID=1404 RepID=UPI000BFD8FA5|nr:PLAT/LH2 domain-containing protein [Priestia megaterium]PGT76825.1 hypothetical protein COD15_03125 [Priestia megaterium]